MTILITGGTGSLGRELKKIYPHSITPTHKELDITNKESTCDFFKSHDIDMIIHTAAMTSVRLCEENKFEAWNTNVTGTKNLVDCAFNSNKNPKFVYISTACVFDGHSGMYAEDSIPYPENFYALTKLLGEREISKLDDSLIIRTNFISKIVWPYKKAFTDRFGTYLFADNVAKGVKEIIDKDLDDIIHLVGDRKMSMFELAKITTPLIEPMTIDDYSGPKLTMDMSLDTKKWKKYKISRISD